MNQYIQIEFQNLSSMQSDLLIAELINIGFEGFEEEENNLKAFIPGTNFDESALIEINERFDVSFVKSVIEETNWNALWESNFQPVLVDNFVGIRADFHEPVMGVDHEIIITPKMSFGTGHHATTYLMIHQMSQIDFNGKEVFDFGTGTGILAILAEKLGAENIIAIDNDEWSISNTTENLEKNKCKKIKLIKSDTSENSNRFDIILANINKNVILDNFNFLANQLLENGMLLLSGLLSEDESDVLKIASRYSLNFIKKEVKDNWICLIFNT